jgi:hypothetical protein
MPKPSKRDQFVEGNERVWDDRRRVIWRTYYKVAAWQTKPSWYAVSRLDETISPDLERSLANRRHEPRALASHIDT